VLIAGLTGTALGLLAGVRGGASDHAVMRLADMQLAFPFILLAITVIGILGPSIRNLILVVGFRQLGRLREGSPRGDAGRARAALRGSRPLASG
jgi:ABC-type dipeptide/oligopeptide/nickel transport systems, permease components